MKTHPLTEWLELTDTPKAELARQLGVCRSYITHITSGRRSPRALLARVSDLTGIPMKKLRPRKEKEAA